MKFEKLTDFMDARVETLGILVLVTFASVADERDGNKGERE